MNDRRYDAIVVGVGTSPRHSSSTPLSCPVEGCEERGAGVGFAM
jgi:hypothetical protein